MSERPDFTRRRFGFGARAPAGVWVGFAMVVGAGGVVGISLAIVLLSGVTRLPDEKLRKACDHTVETLLTTHDPVELERARILVNILDCGVARRIDDWPPARIGGLTR